MTDKLAMECHAYDLDGNLLPRAPKRLTKEQRATMLDIISAVDREEISTLLGAAEYAGDAWRPWFADWPIWSAGENLPGYMPDSPYCLFLTNRAARGYCRELERQEGGGDYVSDYMPVTLREVLG